MRMSKFDYTYKTVAKDKAPAKKKSYIEDPLPVNSKETLLLWGCLGMKKTIRNNRHAYHITGEIINNYTKREILAIKSVKFWYSTGYYARDKGFVETYCTDPIKPGERRGFNLTGEVETQVDEIKEFKLHSMAYTYRDVKTDDDHGIGAKVIIINK